MVSFRLRMNRILFAAKLLNQTQLDDIAHEQTIICGQFCKSRGGLSANEKEEQFESNDNLGCKWLS